MMKNNVIALLVFIGVLIIFIIGFGIYSYNSKDNYSCIDYETNTYYSFKTEKEMREVCNKFNGIEEDTIMSSYSIYNDLINVKDNSFSFSPYVESDNKLAIIVIILDCNNPDNAKKKAIQWFSDHSYNIADYHIDYEYPCQ